MFVSAQLQPARGSIIFILKNPINNSTSSMKRDARCKNIANKICTNDIWILYELWMVNLWSWKKFIDNFIRHNKIIAFDAYILILGLRWCHADWQHFHKFYLQITTTPHHYTGWDSDMMCYFRCQQSRVSHQFWINHHLPCVSLAALPIHSISHNHKNTRLDRCRSKCQQQNGTTKNEISHLNYPLIFFCGFVSQRCLFFVVFTESKSQASIARDHLRQNFESGYWLPIKEGNHTTSFSNKQSRNGYCIRDCCNNSLSHSSFAFDHLVCHSDLIFYGSI